MRSTSARVKLTEYGSWMNRPHSAHMYADSMLNLDSLSGGRPTTRRPSIAEKCSGAKSNGTAFQPPCMRLELSASIRGIFTFPKMSWCCDLARDGAVSVDETKVSKKRAFVVANIEAAGPVLRYRIGTGVLVVASPRLRTRSDDCPPSGDRHQSAMRTVPMTLAF